MKDEIFIYENTKTHIAMKSARFLRYNIILLKLPLVDVWLVTITGKNHNIKKNAVQLIMCQLYLEMLSHVNT
jgi:hypothetical protein